MEYKADGPKFPIVFHVLEVPSFGRNGVWLTIRDICIYFNSRFIHGIVDKREQIQISIETRSLNVEVKKCGAHIIPWSHRQDFHEVLSSISPHGFCLQCPKSLHMGIRFLFTTQGRGKKEKKVKDKMN